jgi:hypothetical protein
MSRGKYLSLPEARKKKQLKQFAKEHPSEGDSDKLEKLIGAMSKTPESDGQTSKEPTDRED